ncbi:MAG: MFS transporter [Candidatus Gastranaerophilaceae bacterium]|jgi:FSR family fosmidomycin resistance protein-like MFS transporter
MENTERKIDKLSSGMLCVGHFTVDSYGGFLTPILPFIAAKLSISIALVSLMISISHLASSIMQPLFGYISDSLSRRFFIIWGLVLAAVFTSLGGVVSNAWLLAFIIIMGNVGVAFYHPQGMTLTNYFAGNKLNVVMGIFTACGTIGYAIGPMISSSLVAKFGLNSTIYAIIPGLIFAFILYSTLPKIPVEIIKKEKISFFEVLKKIFANRLLLILAYIATLNSMIVLSFAIWMPFVWKAQGYSVSTIGYLIALFSLAGGIATFLGAKFANSFGKRAVYYMALLPIMPLGLLCLYFTDKIPVVSFIFFVLIGFFISFGVSTNVVTAQSNLPEYRGVISGVIGGFSWGVMGVLLAPLGFIAEKVGITTVLCVISFIPFVSTLLIKFIPDK